MLKNLKKILCTTVLGTAVLGAASAQFWSFGYENETPDPSIQKPLVIIDSTHQYDLDPHTASYTSEAQILSGLYEGLFSYHPVTLEPVNAICASYKISRDKKRWTFTLKEGVKFSNGEPITANTFRDSWLAVLSNPNASFASLLDCIEGAAEFRQGLISEQEVGIAAKNDLTLVVSLNKPTEHLTKILCHHAFGATSTEPNVYSGAFTVQSYEDGHLVLVKNPEYRDAENVYLPKIEVIQSDDYEENTALYNMGAAHWVTGGATLAKIFNQNSSHIAAEFGTQYLFFKINNAKWNNQKFREALLEAIPYDELRGNYYVPATTLVYPLSGYPEVAGIDEYDLDYAKNLMEEARKDAGISQDEVIEISFAIFDSEYLKSWAEILRKAWEPLGVKLTVQTTSIERYNSAIPYWNADIFEYSWIGDFADPLAFLELFRGNSTLNVANYKNDRFDELLDLSATAESLDEHDKILAQAEQILLDDCVIIPVSHPISLHYIDTNEIGGWQTNALDLHPLKYLYFKKTTVNIPNLVMLTHH